MSMSKFSKSLCLVGAGLSMMSVSASATFLLHSFENNDLLSPQEARLGGQAVPGSGAFSTTGVTDGIASYSVQGEEAGVGSGAKEFIEIVLDASARAALATNPILQWDTTIPVDDDPSDPYNDSDTFFTSVASVGGYQFYGSFNREDVPFDGTTVTTSYEFTPAEVSVLSNPLQGFVVFRFGLNSFEGVQPTAHFDNFRLVPEPASAMLLGLGGLATLRRRR